ncbi:MAG: hypothetical protein ABI723_07370 [Bacteroidia bacterium]
MILTSSQIKQLIASGGSLVIDGSFMTLNQLKQFATDITKSTATITIKNIGNITPAHLKQIAAIAPGQIIFDLS